MRPLGVTGALIFNSGVFAQVLEGRRQIIEGDFERIQRDRRHADVHVLAFEEARTQVSLLVDGLRRPLGGRTKPVFGKIGETTGFEARRMEGERVLEIISSIAFEEEVVPA